MSVTTVDLSEYVDKKVTLIRNLDKPNEKNETAEELDGTLVAVAGDAVMFKPKGKTNPLLIDVADIESIDYAQEKAKALSRKTLKPVQYGQARAHLLERHAYTLTEVNNTSEADAFKMHAEIDHEAADLGHVHGEKDAKGDEADSSDED